MAEWFEIKDQGDAKEWLEKQDHQTQVWLAARCALRALPVLATYAHTTRHGLALSTCRSLLCATAAATCPPAKMQQLTEAARAAVAAVSAAASATDASLTQTSSSPHDGATNAYAAARHAASAAASSAADAAARAAGAAAGAADAAACHYPNASRASRAAAYSAAWNAATVDANTPKTWGKLSHDDPQLDALANFWGGLKSQWQADGPHWSFWITWYEAVRDGTWTNWDLIFRIATGVSKDDWEAGPARVADRIAEIEARLLVERLPLNETIALNSDTGRFFGTPAEISNPKLLSATLVQLRDALDDALDDENNGLQERDLEVRKLRRMMDRRSNDPQYVEMTCTSVGRSLTLKTAGPDAELPASDENVALIEALREAAQGLRASHPEIEENRRILSEQAFKELPDAALAELAEAQPVLEAITEGYIHDDLTEDIPLMLSEDKRVGPPRLGGAERNPVLARYDEMQRTFGRVARIALFLRQTPDLIHKIDRSAGFKAALIAITIGTLASWGIALF